MADEPELAIESTLKATAFVVEPWPSFFVMMGAESRTLLKINADGTVEGEIEDAGPAAKIFVESVRSHLSAMIEAARAGANNDQSK